MNQDPIVELRGLYTAQWWREGSGFPESSFSFTSSLESGEALCIPSQKTMCWGRKQLL